MPAGMPRFLYSQFLKYSLWVLPAFAFVKLIRRASILQTFKISTVADIRSLGVGILIGLFYLMGVVWDVTRKHNVSISVLVEKLATRGGIPSLWNLSISFTEEFLFRGLVLHEISRTFGFWRGNLFCSLLFTMIHWPYWLCWSKGIQLDFFLDSGAIFLFSLVLGYLVKKTKSLWPAIIVHALNNFIVGVF
ncbi:CPBP family intramembrane metalloprotease [bacterium]|nr:CPBP family intramembrane metalloprotease [bacterium]